jgi:hypothetical protein
VGAAAAVLRGGPSGVQITALAGERSYSPKCLEKRRILGSSE